MLEIDIELALLDLPESDFHGFSDQLPKNYILENKYDKGWGTVIRTKENLSNDVDDAINGFLMGLIDVSEIIKNNNAVLRVGVFYETVTYTFRLNRFDILNDLSIKLEVSTYPSDDD